MLRQPWQTNANTPPMTLTWENPAHQTCSHPGRTHRRQESPEVAELALEPLWAQARPSAPPCPAPRDSTDWDARRPPPGSPASPGPHLGSGTMPAFPGEGRQGTCPRGRGKPLTCQTCTVARRERCEPTVHTQPKGLPPFGGDSGARVTVNRTQLARDQARLRQSASSSRPTVLLPHLPEHLK